MEALEQKLTELISEQKSFREKAEAEQKSHGTVLDETRKALEAVQRQVDAIDSKLTEKHQRETDNSRGIGDVLKENESVQRLMRDHSGKAVIQFDGKQVSDLFERKTTITSAAVGSETSGILRHDRDAGIVLDARPVLKVRNVLASRPTSMQLIDFVKINSAMTVASPQAEAGTKQEKAVTFTTASVAVKTIAAWIPATRQILEDFTELEGFLRSELPYRVDQCEEQELLAGSNLGAHLNGLITQATSFDTSLLSASAGWTRFDIIGRVRQQIAAANELAPSFIVLHPTDWWSLRLTKDSYGRYILGDPQQNVGVPNIFGLTVVETTSITSGTFLIGSGNAAASEIRDRMGMQVEISTEHGEYFTSNMVAIRAEKRLALVVKRPASYITGSFTTSPE